MMNAVHPLHHVLVFLMFMLCMQVSPLGSPSLSKDRNVIKCIGREREALLLFRQGVTNENNQLGSWKKEDEEDCCKWKGVGCHNTTGHVTHLYLSSLLSTNSTGVTIGHSLLDLPYLTYLDLSSNHLARIPYFIGSFKKLVHLDCSNSNIWAWGSFPSQIGNLSNLQYLNLSFNNFDGPIPTKFIGSLNGLRYLDLSYSWIPGVIPQELGNLSKLQHLDLGHNLFLEDGDNINWLFNLSSLTYLDLSTVYIDPPGIWASFIQRIPSLSILRLVHCNLSGPSSTLSRFSSSLSTLNLEGNHINSSIFNWLSYLSGSLVDLDLGMNDLQGRIPESFGHMTALTHLHLHENQLNGVLSLSISNLSRLQVADFSSNNFTGNLDDLLSGTFPLLQILDLSNNHLKGSLPDFTGFSSLQLLYLDNNEFSGSVPDFTGCSSLRELQLGENQLTEWEAQSTGLLSSLEELDLSRNSINSTISELHLFNLSSLKYLRTSFNSLTFEFSSKWLPPFQLQEVSLASCNLGPKFPDWIRNQRNIDHLDISNNRISDTIPFWFWNLSSSMMLLNLSSNQIRGKLSWKYVYIEEIDLSSNYLVGSLPPIPATCSKINLSQNKLSGTLFSLPPVEYSSLDFLDVSHNHFFGAIPDNWMYFQDLVFLNLGYNKSSGRIPMSIGQLVYLQTLILRNNKLYGELPASLRNCRELGFLDFGLNEISGKVPSWIGEDLSKIYALILKSNRLYGSLPYELCHLSNLHFLDLSMNRIFGNIPPCFGNLTAMIQRGTVVTEHTYSSVFSFQDAIVSSEFPGAPAESSPISVSAVMATTTSYSYFVNVVARWKGQEFEYGRNFAYLKMIDLSTNELTGEIPAGITRLVELKGLNMSGNKFNGKVPLEIGQLKGLECLDLSRNRFSGEIPSSMSGLNFLAYLDVSNNNFSGRIPSGTQLQGFSISTYEGNTGLCGKPLTIICPEDEPADHIHPSSGEVEVDGEDIEYKRWLYISAALGFSSTFWGITGTLVLNRHWRHAYFLFLYNLKERVYVAIAVHIARLQRKL